MYLLIFRFLQYTLLNYQKGYNVHPSTTQNDKYTLHNKNKKFKKERDKFHGKKKKRSKKIRKMEKGNKKKNSKIKNLEKHEKRKILTKAQKCR